MIRVSANFPKNLKEDLIKLEEALYKENPEEWGPIFGPPIYGAINEEEEEEEDYNNINKRLLKKHIKDIIDQHNDSDGAAESVVDLLDELCLV